MLFMLASKEVRNLAYYIYKDTAGQWRWRLVAGNNRIIANSGESYWNKSDCLHAITLVKGSGSAPVYEG
jgi:uncharacterized protein YegP (UPF0339 family)